MIKRLPALKCFALSVATAVFLSCAFSPYTRAEEIQAVHQFETRIWESCDSKHWGKATKLLAEFAKMTDGKSLNDWQLQSYLTAVAEVKTRQGDWQGASKTWSMLVFNNELSKCPSTRYTNWAKVETLLGKRKEALAHSELAYTNAQRKRLSPSINGFLDAHELARLGAPVCPDFYRAAQIAQAFCGGAPEATYLMTLGDLLSTSDKESAQTYFHKAERILDRISPRTSQWYLDAHKKAEDLKSTLATTTAAAHSPKPKLVEPATSFANESCSSFDLRVIPNPSTTSQTWNECEAEAQENWRRGRFDRAREWFAAAARKARKPSVHDRQLIANLDEIAKCDLVTGRSEEARNIMLFILHLREKTQRSESYELSLSYSDLARFYEITGDNEKAEFYFVKLLDLTRRVEQPAARLVADCLEQLAQLYIRTRCFDKAIHALHDQKAIWQNVSPRSERVATTLDQLGIVSARMSKFKDAEQFHMKALKIRNSMRAKSAAELKNSSYIHLGDLFFAEKNYEQAANYYEKLLSSSSAICGDQKYPDVIPALAFCFYTKGDYTKADVFQRKWIQLLKTDERMPRDYALLPALKREADILELMGNDKEAEQCLLEEIDLSKKVDQGLLGNEQGNAYMALARFYQRKLNWAKCQQACTSAAQVYTYLGSTAGTTEARNLLNSLRANRGFIHRNATDFP